MLQFKRHTNAYEPVSPLLTHSQETHFFTMRFSQVFIYMSLTFCNVMASPQDGQTNSDQPAPATSTSLASETATITTTATTVTSSASPELCSGDAQS